MPSGMSRNSVLSAGIGPGVDDAPTAIQTGRPRSIAARRTRLMQFRSGVSGPWGRPRAGRWAGRECADAFADGLRCFPARCRPTSRAARPALRPARTPRARLPRCRTCLAGAASSLPVSSDASALWTFFRSETLCYLCPPDLLVVDFAPYHTGKGPAVQAVPAMPGSLRLPSAAGSEL